MKKIISRAGIEEQTDPIDDFFDCVTYCSVENFADENACQTICMERHLMGNYF